MRTPYIVDLSPSRIPERTIVSRRLFHVIGWGRPPLSRRLVITSSGVLRIGETLTPELLPNAIATDNEEVVEHNAFESGSGGNTEAKQGEWYVLIGAYRSRSFVEKRAADIREHGYSTRIVPLQADSSFFYQLRIGGYDNATKASYAAAELKTRFACDTLVIAAQSPVADHIAKLAQRLKNTNEAAAYGALMKITADDHSDWYVQLGAYRNPDNVQRLTSLLEQAGIQYKLVPIPTSTDTIIQVRVGGYSTKLDGKTVSNRFNSWLESNTLLIKTKRH